MARRDKLLEAMRRNPRGDWTIDDVARLCRARGLELHRPLSGSHFVVVAPGRVAQLTLPARRPIKPVYIRMLVAYVDQAQDGSTDE